MENRILLVDDEEEIVGLVEECCKKRDFMLSGKPIPIPGRMH